MYRLPIVLLVCLSLSVLLSTTSTTAMANELKAGALDRPQVLPGDRNRGRATTQSPSVNSRNNPIQSQAQLRKAVRDEQKELEKLPRNQLVAKAERGERAAQVILAADFAREATRLSFAPSAANEALGDAAFWNAMAASGSFPGAPSLDQAGSRRYPIRIQRELRP